MKNVLMTARRRIKTGLPVSHERPPLFAQDAQSAE